MKTTSSRQRPGTVTRALLVLLALGLYAAPAAGITWGQKDTAGKYPNVGTILVSIEGTVSQWCSGTLIHERVLLTAGHCTNGLQNYVAAGLVEHVWVSFDFDPLAAAHTWLEVASWITHPDFSFKPRSNWHDNGAVILAEPVVGIEPAQLPEEGFLDHLMADGALGHGTNGAKFSVVGYGRSFTFPPPGYQWVNVRQFALSEFRALLPAWLRMSQQGRTGDGGTCYGDSGGPAFWEGPGGETILVATATWGDIPCVSTGFNQRIDLASALAFIQAVIDSLAVPALLGE